MYLLNLYLKQECNQIGRILLVPKKYHFQANSSLCPLQRNQTEENICFWWQIVPDCIWQLHSRHNFRRFKCLPRMPGISRFLWSLNLESYDLIGVSFIWPLTPMILLSSIPRKSNVEITGAMMQWLL